MLHAQQPNRRTRALSAHPRLAIIHTNDPTPLALHALGPSAGTDPPREPSATATWRRQIRSMNSRGELSLNREQARGGVGSGAGEGRIGTTTTRRRARGELTLPEMEKRGAPPPRERSRAFLWIREGVAFLRRSPLKPAYSRAPVAGGLALTGSWLSTSPPQALRLRWQSLRIRRSLTRFGVGAWWYCGGKCTC